MSRKHLPGWVSWFGGFLFAALFCGTIIYLTHHSPERDLEEWERIIAESLPSGTTKEEVKAWLTSSGFKPEEIQEKDQYISVTSCKDYFFYWSGEMCFVFTFSKTEKLESHSISWEDWPL